MVAEDLEYLKTLPNYRKYLEGGALVKRVRSIYPSVTYPCHTTMVTGAYPDKHGITSNFDRKLSMENMPWTWFHSYVKTQDIFTAAKRAGYSTAAVFWPVTACHPDIDSLIAEYWTQSKGESLREAFARAGSDEQMLQVIERNQNLLVERVHPMCDEFLVSCACDIIRERRPDLLFIHPANIDGYRHETGLFNGQVTRGIEETDQFIGRIMEAAKQAGLAESVNLVLTSDHGQLEIKRTVNINVLFADKGLLRTDSQGKIVDWDAYCLSNGLSALVYLKDPCNKRLYQKTQELLYELRDEGVYGIGEVMTENEARNREHLGGEFSFIIETDGYTSFGASAVRPLVNTCDLSDYRYGKATHGHLPEKGPQPFFAAKGPEFRDGAVLDSARLVDQAPTYAKILGFSLPETDGQPMTELLKLSGAR